LRPATTQHKAGSARPNSSEKPGLDLDPRAERTANDTTGNSPGSKWVGFNTIVEHLDYGRRYTSRTNQVQRSFEDTGLKQRALELVLAA